MVGHIAKSWHHSYMSYAVYDWMLNDLVKVV
jgi:hypothetical protein